MRRGAREMMGPVRRLRRFSFLMPVEEEVLLREEVDVWESWEFEFVVGFIDGEDSRSKSVVLCAISPGGGRTTSQRKPTTRPEEHSCRNSIASQKRSRSLMVFQRLDFCLEGLATAREPASSTSPTSSSRSCMKRALGSSGNRGRRQRGGAVSGTPRASANSTRGFPGVQFWLFSELCSFEGKKDFVSMPW